MIERLIPFAWRWRLGVEEAYMCILEKDSGVTLTVHCTACETLISFELCPPDLLARSPWVEVD